MKKVLISCLLLVSINISAQQRQLPEGWDRIILEGKEAYMNIITGETTYKFPTKPAKKPMRKVEVDASIVHKVKKGETLYSITRKYNISTDDIYKLNAQFDANNLKIGQEIIVGYDKAKEGTIVYEEDTRDYTDKSNNTFYYVKKGETLYSISRKYHISISKLKEYNGLTSNVLSIGQKLRVAPY